MTLKKHVMQNNQSILVLNGHPKLRNKTFIFLIIGFKHLHLLNNFRNIYAIRGILSIEVFMYLVL